jgi:hypothetical protein
MHLTLTSLSHLPRRENKQKRKHYSGTKIETTKKISPINQHVKPTYQRVNGVGMFATDIALDNNPVIAAMREPMTHNQPLQTFPCPFQVLKIHPTKAPIAPPTVTTSVAKLKLSAQMTLWILVGHA